MTSRQAKKQTGTIAKPEVKSVPEVPSGTADKRQTFTSETFEYELPPVDSLAQLVNNKYQSDVAFKVGKSGTIMYAHKNIITLASKVMFIQFNGQFVDAQQDSHVAPIAVEDIEPDTFLDLLRYMYCRTITIDPDTMLDVYYAAKKYMLVRLQRLCEDEIRRLTTDDTVLKIFQHNRFYDFDKVDEMCLKIICDNPLKFFKQADFLELDHGVLELINACASMNCQVSQMQEAIKLWEQTNYKFENPVEPKSKMCQERNFFSLGRYSANINTHLHVTVRSPIALHGIGVLVGVKCDSFVGSSSVSIEVLVNRKLQASKTVPIYKKLHTHEMMFEKVIFDKEGTIHVKVTKPESLKDALMFHFCGFHMADNLGKLRLSFRQDVGVDANNRPQIYLSSSGNSYNYGYNNSYQESEQSSQDEQYDEHYNIVHNTPINCIGYLLCQESTQTA